jgi:uncharacterized protein YodC (DUF2158 family)
MNFTFKIWSQVRLKSGGPEMLITSCTKNPDGTEFFTVKWKENGEHFMTDFPVELLELIN